MRMKLKNLKKLISVAIICTMIAALFVPTLSVQAAETQALESAVENYTDVENSEYKITDVECQNYSMYVYYSVPQDCRIVMAVYDGVTGRMRQLETSNLYASSNDYAYFGFNDYGNRKFTYKLFIVDFNNRPLGKSYSEDVEITDYCEVASFWYSDLEEEPHPTAAIREDHGLVSYNSSWSVNTDGVLTVTGDVSPYTNIKYVSPWDEYREGINSIVFSGYVNSLRNYVFQGLNKVKEVSLPNVCDLDDNSFVDMAGLETVNIGMNTYYISGGAFINCPSLKNLVVDEASDYYKSVDGVLYSKDGTTLIKYPAGKTDRTFVVPDSVENIERYAFEGAVNLEKIVMNDNVTEIGEYAFENCTSLSDITLSSDCTSLLAYTFFNCSSLKNIELPDSVGYISDCCFENTSLERINIPTALYSNSTGFLESLPETVRSITVSEGNEYFTVENGVLLSADKTVLIKYPCGAQSTSFTAPESVKTIESGAFKNSKNLQSVTMGANVSTINSNAFENCTSLKSAVLTNVKAISSELFKNCTSLEYVDLGNPESINDGAFYGCKSIETFTIPASVEYIYGNVFGFCDNLERIEVEEGNSRYCTIDDCLYIETILISYPNAKASDYTVNSDTTEIDSYAFSGRTSLTNITIPDSVTYIGDSAFSDCTNLRSVSMSDNVSTIYQNTFRNCTSLSTIKLPNSLEYINDSAFFKCKSLKTVELPKSGSWITIYEKAFCYSGLESITIPERVDMSCNAFFGCYNLKSIKFEGYCCYRSPLFAFWNFDDITIYYPKGEESWSSSNLNNYQHKDSIKWVAYDDGSGEYTGKYTFTGLEANCEYIVGLNDGTPSDGLLNDDSTLFVDQLRADSNGKITMNYTLKYNTDNIVPFVLGAPKYDISNASIKIGEIIYSGRAQDKPDNYTVTSIDGKELVEGVDYLVTYDSGFDGPGSFFLSVVGIGNYYGEVCQRYTVLGTEYDVDGDGMITIRDTTAIQFYLAGIRTPRNLYAADANGDGVISVADVTHIQKLLAGIC